MATNQCIKYISSTSKYVYSTVVCVSILQLQHVDVLTSSTKQPPPGIFLLGSFPLRTEFFFLDKSDFIFSLNYKYYQEL